MGGISFSHRAVLLLVVCGFCQVSTAWKPEMTPAGKEMVIQEGDELRLKCRGGGEIQFSTLATMSDIINSNFSISKDENSGTYTFTRPAAIREDTGWYACAEEGVYIFNDERNLDHESNEIAWIYVYVNSSKPFVVAPMYELVTAMEGDTLVVPCRTTSPDLRVRTEINWGMTDIPENTEYDPKIGFMLRNVGPELGSQSFECLIDEPEPATASYSLHILAPEPLPPTRITLDQVRHVVWGKNLTVDCEITVAVGRKFSMSWFVPESIPKERWSYTPSQVFVREEEDKLVTWKTVLTVKDVEKTDGGNYTCHAYNPVYNSDATAVIRIWDPSDEYMNVTVDGASRVVENEKGSVNWKIAIDSFPGEPTYLWYQKNLKGETILLEDSEKNGKYTHYTDRFYHHFGIKNLGVGDNGNYTIHFEAGNKKTDINLELIVRCAPLVSIGPLLQYYAPGKSATFTCQTLGQPLPNITWIIKEFPNITSDENPVIVYSSNARPEQGPVGAYYLKSTLEVPINQSGNLICQSCNDVRCVNSTEPFFVSDVNGAFNVTDPGIITEGDDISVTCGASVYNFTNEITWISEIKPENQELQKTRMSVTNRQTKFSSQSILKIRDVRKSDDGTYRCEAVGKDTGPENKTFTLTVQGEQEPRFTRTDMNNTEISIDRNKEKNKLFNCFAEGRPAPRVIWYKDGKRISENEQFKFLNNNSTLKVIYFGDDDSGRYLCRAENRIDVAEAYMDIKILVKSPSVVIWISLICVLIAIIIIVITFMGIKVHRERKLRKELLEAGLTHFEEGALECLNPELTVDDQAELLPYDKKWEFPRENLKIGKQLGSGAFGVVVKAEARGICVEGEVTTVAVKMVRRTAEPSYMKALSSELKIMIHLGKHLNVVNLLGACTKTILTKRELYVIVEYCRYGNLHNYLQRHRSSFIDQIDPVTQKIDSNIGMERLARSESVGSQNRLQYAALSFSRSISIRSSDSNSGNELVDYRQGTDFVDINMSPDGGVLSNNSVQPGWRSNYRGDYKDQNLKPICTQDLLCWAWQVSRGMEYLSSRNVLHGDLAARNILLAEDNIVKICDFGLAKNMYKDNNYKKKGDGPLPIKWMAVESIRDRIFSTHSDVWSFGIVLWEFFTLARTPYPGMEAEKQYDRLIEGYRMEKPEYATDEIYELMTQCWKAKPTLRPSFPELADKFGTLLNDSIRTHYMDLNTPYMDMNTIAMENGQSDYLTMMSSPNHDYDNAPEPTSPGRPDSTYLAMHALADTCDSGIFSPRVQLEESHFNFPPSAKNTSINSDSEDCIDSDPMPTPEDPYIKPIDVKQRRAEFVKQREEQAPVERDSGYCNIPNSPNSLYPNLNTHLSENVRNLDQTQSTDKFQRANNKDVSPAIISGQDNYINLPKQKSDRSNTTVDSFSNPSYVIMSKMEDGRQLV